MFREKGNSKMQLDQVGIGSVLQGKSRWLIVGFRDEVSLLNLETMRITDKPPISVEDVNFLSIKEARMLTDLTNEHFSFSDYDFNSKGLKEIK